MTERLYELPPPTTGLLHPPARLRIAASYAATDGSCPESIEIEFHDLADLKAGGNSVLEIIGALAMAPSARYNLTPTHPLMRGTSSSDPSAASRQS